MFCAAIAVAGEAPPQEKTTDLIGVVVHKKISFSYDEKERAGTFVGLGSATGVTSGDKKLIVTFTLPEVPAIAACEEDFKQDQIPGTQYNIWGHGHLQVEQKDGEPQITIALGQLSDCESVAYFTEAPVMPPIFPDGSPGLRAAFSPATAPAPFGGLMTMEDFNQLREAAKPLPNAAPFSPDDAFRILTDHMMQKVHEIAIDKKLEKEAKEAALRALVSADLSPQDISMLEDYGLHRPFLAGLPPEDRAKLHFIVNDTLVSDAEKKSDIQSFLPPSLRPAPPPPPEEPPSLIDRLTPAMVIIGLFVLLVLAWRGLPSSRKDAVRRHKFVAATPVIILFAAVGLFFYRGPSSEFCGINPHTHWDINVKFCAEDLLNIPDPDKIIYPGCAPGEADPDHTTCFK